MRSIGVQCEIILDEPDTVMELYEQEEEEEEMDKMDMEHEEYLPGEDEEVEEEDDLELTLSG